ncbi:USO1-intracellular transport [Fusarium pseudocircinatum]|uniref:USO1-intracellular transport n=1 Tax=Fusarium pseudocircinatum TaxID=56676 RepID=A0A8H5LAT8_9HYPO|nr:USO1-intracellular transport [Fusarium pseudocircinatum]
MADAEEKARKEKIAAAKKRVEQLKKKNNKKATPAAKQTKPEPAETAAPETVAEKTEAAPDSEEKVVEEPKKKAQEKPPAKQPAQPLKVETQESSDEDDDSDEDSSSDEETSASATPSLAQQSKLRSTSFRAGSVTTGGAAPASPFSPDGETAPDIYRKHMARIEELEKENKRLSKEAADSEKRWQKAENELADIREADGEDSEKAGGQEDGLLDSLKSQVASLQRQNTQLQQQVSRGPGHGHRPSMSVASPPADLKAELEAKTATIESMEIEISKLRAQVERHASGSSSEKEQVTALEDKVARAEAAAGKAQRELQDLKHNLERTAEKAVREGSERTSAETKIKTLEHELEEVKSARDELEKKVEALDKKATTLTTLHKEQDSRLQAIKKEKEKAEHDVTELRAQVEKLENENAKLRSRKSMEGGGGLDDEGVDELEDEERQKLERKIRALESEVHELRSGAWIEKRRELEATSPGFHDVDLSPGHAMSPTQRRKSGPGGGGIGDFFTSGLNALAGGNDDDFLEDDDMDFDEDAFRKAQEEESKRRIERIKEIKRSLKHWEGWRLDIVENRRGGNEGVGEIFDV